MSTKPRDKVFRGIYVILFIAIIILFLLQIKSLDKNIYSIAFNSVIIIFWVLIFMFPRDMLYQSRSIFKINRKKEVKVEENEIWIYRILAVIWILLIIGKF